MKRYLALFLSALMLSTLLAACGNGASSEEPSSEAPAAQPAANEATTSLPEEREEPASEPEAGQEDDTPAPDKDLQEIFDTLAKAAGLPGIIEVSAFDLSMSGGITTDNIVEMVAGQSNIGGDSGMVLVLYVKNGTEAQVTAELEKYRNDLAADDRYAEFAASREATADARVAAYGNYVVYAAVSAEAGAAYSAVDDALSMLFGE